MQENLSLSVILDSWETLSGPATQLRHEVFVLEQKVPFEMEIDEFDAISIHTVVYDLQGKAVGTGRLLPDGHIGRIAVHKSNRGQGIGKAILKALIQQAQEKQLQKLILSAQTHAQSFYQAFGFTAQGSEFMDAGIAHIEMSLTLSAYKYSSLSK